MRIMSRRKLGMRTRLATFSQSLKEVILDTRGAAEYLHLGVTTLEKRRIAGVQPRFVRVGRAIRYRLSDLNAFLEDNIRNSTSDTGKVR
jgi:hypothetical protein